MLWGPHEEVLGLVRRQRDGGPGYEPLLSFSRKERGGKVSRFRTGQSGSFQWALVDRGYPWLSGTWPWGDVGR